MYKRRKFIKKSMTAGIGIAAGMNMARGKDSSLTQTDLKLGIIGLDTSHSPAFTKYIHDPQNENMRGAEVIAAYPYGSQKIESSYKRIPEYTEQMQSLGVEIINDLGELIDKVDAILLETNDGTLHLEQALQVIKAGKPIFVDKPVAAGLKDVVQIYAAAEENKVPIFSSSSLRYMKKAQEVRNEKVIGQITGAMTYSPEHWEPSHSDLYWYGIHGVEILYTIMGTGCQRVRRVLTDTTDLVIGEWHGGLLGTFRGDLQGRQQYGGTAFGEKEALDLGKYDGYGPLIEAMIDFFRTGKLPVDPEETLELYTFMEAADVSKARKGDWVDLEEVLQMAGG